MAQTRIKYRSGYKYQLAEDYPVSVGIKPPKKVDTEFITLDLKGNLKIQKGYAWDGPSGPVVDQKENMRASLVHDALYQLMRQRKISSTKFKTKADRLFKKMCIQDGIPKHIAQAYYLGLKIGGKPATKPESRKKVHLAP